MELDQIIFRSIFGFVHKNLLADNIVVILAQYLPYLLVIGFFVLLADVAGGKKKIFYFAETALVLIIARGIAVGALHYFVPRERPFVQFGFEPLITESPLTSFPSGHAAFFFGLAVAVWSINRGWGIAYLIAAAVNAFARVYCGVHFPSDILVGAFIGVALGLLVVKLLAPYKESQALNEPEEQPPEILDSPI